jgi:DNA repair protein RecO (recombination protein O)
MKDGLFVDHIPSHPYFVEPLLSKAVAGILKTHHPSELVNAKLNQKMRREILLALQTYYALHIQDFGILKTLPVVHTILGE